MVLHLADVSGFSLRTCCQQNLPAEKEVSPAEFGRRPVKGTPQSQFEVCLGRGARWHEAKPSWSDKHQAATFLSENPGVSHVKTCPRVVPN